MDFLSSEAQNNNSNTAKEIILSSLYEEKKASSVHINWLYDCLNWFTNTIGLKLENLRIREHIKTELSHYSTATFDIDFKFPFGYKELMGIAYRGNYDLTQHQKFSKSKLEFFDEKTKEKFLPHVIEPSVGIDRLFFAVISNSYIEDEKRGNVVLNITNKLAPYKVAVFPLLNKPELESLARKIYNNLIENETVGFYDRSGTIGRRYARQDEIGTPYCITVDFEAIEEGESKDTVTIRDRISTNQKRVKLGEVVEIIDKLVKGKITFNEL